MKTYVKLFMLAITAIIVCSLASCSKNEVANVNIDLKLGPDNPTYKDTIYVVQGEKLVVLDATCTNLEEGAAYMNKVTYYWDEILQISPSEMMVAPYACEHQTTAETLLGFHCLDLTAQVAAEGKSISIYAVRWLVKVVKDKSEIPAEAKATSLLGKEQ